MVRDIEAREGWVPLSRPSLLYLMNQFENPGKAKHKNREAAENSVISGRLPYLPILLLASGHGTGGGPWQHVFLLVVTLVLCRSQGSLVQASAARPV